MTLRGDGGGRYGYGQLDLIDADHFPPPPRAVRARFPGAGCALWFPRLFILPHTVIGLWMIGHFSVVLLWLVAGSNVTGRIVDAKESTSSKGRKYYEIAYDVPMRGGGSIRKTEGASQGFYESLPRSVRAHEAGASADVRVRVLKL